MILRPNAKFKKSLAVRSTKKWPEALVPMAWRGELICGFSGTSPLVCELDENESITKVAQTFIEVYTDLGLVDLVQLKKNSSELTWGPDFFKEVLTQMAHGQDVQWLKVIDVLEQMPSTLLNIWQQRNLQFGDLRPLLSLEKAGPEWDVLQKAMFSKSEWCHVIEWFTEVSLMNKHEDLIKLESVSQKPKELFLKLKDLRFPETAKKDRSEMNFWKQMPWPKNTQAEFRRQGDQTKTYVAMNFNSLQDLKKIAKDLHQMAEHQEREH